MADVFEEAFEAWRGSRPLRPVRVLYVFEPDCRVDDFCALSQPVEVFEILRWSFGPAARGRTPWGDIGDYPLNSLAPPTPEALAAIAEAERLWRAAQEAVEAAKAAFAAIPRISEAELRAMMEVSTGVQSLPTHIVSLRAMMEADHG